MSIRKQATFTEEAFERAAIVAAYQNRTFSRYIVHCVEIETTRRLETATRNLSQKAETSLSTEGQGHREDFWDALRSLEREIIDMKQKMSDNLATAHSPDVQFRT